MLAAILLSAAAPADDGPAAAYAGRRVADVIDEFRAAGLELAYSTNVVTEDLHVAFEPEAGTPLDIVRQILRPHGLRVRAEAGVYVIVRDAAAAPDRQPGTVPTTDAARPGIETVVVAASRYEISREIAASRFTIDRHTIQDMPDIGEDPVRVSQRLPGAAASGASAVAYLRGGDADETGIMLNGQWLFDPFHMRDYQNIFSAIDARAIDGVEIYTGGFPVRYGDRMSGLVLMDSLDPERARHHEIGISVFNTSLLTAGRQGGSRWLFSARRGNLDLVIDPQFGRPSYFDVFGEVAIELAPGQRVSLNALVADDQVELVLESDPAEREAVVSDTRNAQAWLRLDSAWSDALASSTILSFVDYANRRRGESNDPEKMIAAVSDDRDVRRFNLRQDWVWNPSPRHLLRWGLLAGHGRADYRYRGTASYFALQALFGRADVDRSVSSNPRGGSYALYLSERWMPHPRAVIEWGLRWDDQTYTDLAADSQLSPRIGLLLRPWQRTELRFSAGRYYQSQPIQALQVEDGIARFWPAQRADHLIGGIRHLAGNGISWRAELFSKEIRKLRPRFENLYNPLGALPELQGDRVRIEPARARARGVELSADRARGAWNWWASYTLSRVTDRIEGRDVPRSWDQRHAFQAGAGWRDERWQFSAAVSVHSGWPTTALVLEQDVAVPGPRNALRLPSFASLDFRVSRRFRLRRGTLLAFVELSNALDRRNVCCIDWDLDEDASGNPVLESSPDYWMPLLPAIGVLWEF